MAYQKTKGRSVFVQPTGMPDLSGFRAYAQSLGQLSDLTNKLAVSAAQSEYNDMIIQAEKDGRTAGAKYTKDENGNMVLTPLVDTSYASASKIANVNDRKAIEEMFRKTAIDTYASQLALDAGNVADASLAQSPLDPQAVDTAFQGFVDGLREDLDPDVVSAVLPRIAAEFTTRVGKANAARIEKVKKDQINTNLASVDNLYDRLSVMATVGPGNTQEDQGGFNAMVEDINKSLDQNLSALKVNGYTDSQIDEIRRIGHGRVVTAGAKANAEKVFYLPEEQGGGYANALNGIVELKKFYLENQLKGLYQMSQSEIDSMAEAAVSHLASLKKVDDAQKQSIEKSQIDLKNNMALAISAGLIQDESEIWKLNISPERKLSLLNSFRDYQKGIQSTNKERATASQKENDEIFAGYVTGYQDLTLPASVRQEYKNRAEAMRNVVSASKWDGFVKARNKQVKESIKGDNEQKLAQIEFQMSDAGGFSMKPKDIESLRDELISSGVIGSGDGAVISLSSFNSKLDSYSSKYEKYMNERYEANAALSAAQRGLEITATQRNIVEKEAYANRLEQDQNGETIFHLDPEIREQNRQKIIEFVTTYNMIPTDVANALNSLNDADFGEEEFSEIVSLYNQIYMSMSQGINGSGAAGNGVGQMHTEAIMRRSGVDVDSYNVIRFEGAKAWASIQAQGEKSTDGGRILRSIQSTLGVDFDEAIKKVMNDAIEPQSFIEMIKHDFLFFQRKEDPTITNGINKLFKNSPSGYMTDPSEVVFNDRRMATWLRSNVLAHMVDKKYPPTEKFLKIAVRNVIGKNATKIGLNFDSDGNPSLTFNPWYKQVVESIGDNIDAIDGTPEEAFFREARRVALRPDVAINDRVRDALKDEDTNLIVHSNNQYGPEQTYVIQVEMPDGSRETVLNDFNYNFKQSMDYKVMQLATSRVKNSTFLKFLSNMNSLNPTIIRNVSENIFEEIGERDMYISSDTPILFKKAMEYMNEAMIESGLAVAPVSYSGKDIDKQIFPDDIEVLNAWLQGAFDSEESFLKAIGRIKDE